MVYEGTMVFNVHLKIIFVLITPIYVFISSVIFV